MLALVWLTRRAIALGIPEPFARFVTIGALVALIVTGLGVWRCSHDKAVIAQHDAAQVASTAIADRKADASAATTRRTDDARLINETAQLERSAVHAPAILVSDARRIWLECVRTQQAARRNGGEPPAC